MATFYLDFEGGNDANDGTSYANRWKTFSSGATTARTAPGDTIRVMASPTPTLVGDATWTQYSKTVTLSGAVTQVIDNCETAWTASANVTATAVPTGKQGTNYANLAIAAGFTTGLAAYKATGTLDLSAYQQVSFWLYTGTAIAASTLSLRLCSDAVGAVTVATIAIPAVTPTGAWVVITVDTAGALPAAVESVALYADLDPGTVTVRLDHIIACKASSSADSLTLNSLIGKVHNNPWVASTAYAQNTKRIPTANNRNGFCYKVQNVAGGTTGGAEPTWPTEIGSTVTDNDITWVCEELEDTWHGIQSIVGTTVLLDADSAAATSAQGRGYQGATETIATYKFQPITFAITNVSNTNGLAGNIQESGTADAPITYSGGWNRTDMSTRVGATWVDGRSGFGTLSSVSTSHHVIDGFGLARVARGLYLSGPNNIVVRNLSVSNASDSGVYIATNTVNLQMNGVQLSNGLSGFVIASNVTGRVIRSSFANSRSGPGMTVGSVLYFHDLDLDVIRSVNNSSYGINNSAGHSLRGSSIVTANNATAGIASIDTNNYFRNCSFGEATEFASATANMNWYTYSQDHDQTPGTHLITSDQGTIVSATDQRHTASGIAWKFLPTGSRRVSAYPLKLSVAKVACATSTAVSVKIWTRRDNTNIKGQLFIRGGQIAGVPSDVTVACEPAINTWTEYTLPSFTPTSNGVVEVFFHVWDGVGTTNSFWIDDLSVS